MHFPIQTDKKIECNKPDNTVIKKKNLIFLLIDLSCSFDISIIKRADEKLKKCNPLESEKLRV